MTYEVLATVAAEWPTTNATPEGVSALLGTSRAAFELAWFHYEMLVVAGTWSLLAVETALRERLGVGARPSLKALLGHAEREGLVVDDDLARLHAGRQLRNMLAHARDQQAWTLGMAAPILAASHHAVGRLYPDR